MSGPGGLRDTLLARGEELRARDPHFLPGNWRQRAPGLGLAAGAIAIYVSGLVSFGFSPARLLHGAGRLIDIALLMFPPIRRAGRGPYFILAHSDRRSPSPFSEHSALRWWGFRSVFSRRETWSPIASCTSSPAAASTGCW